MFGRKRTHTGADAPFWNHRGWILSAAFLALVLVMSVVTWLTSTEDGQGLRDTGAENPGPLTPAAGGQGADARPAGCRTDDADTARPTAPPPDIDWRPLGGAKIPVSPTAGPLQAHGPVLWCFAHTPLGAVMAAHTIPSHMSGADWRTVTEQQVVAGTPRDIFVAQRSTVPEGQGEAGAVGSYAGFAVTAYSPDEATVRLLIKNGSGGYGSTFVVVQWDGGDWKVRPRTNGALYTSMTSVSGNAGFVMWRV